MAGGVGDDELAASGGEVAVGDVDGDALLALGAEAVGEQGEIEHAGAGGALAFDGAELVFVDAAGVVEEATDEGGFAVVDGAGGGEAEEVFAAFCCEVGVDSKSSARSAARPGETESGSGSGVWAKSGLKAGMRGIPGLGFARGAPLAAMSFVLRGLVDVTGSIVIVGEGHG